MPRAGPGSGQGPRWSPHAGSGCREDAPRIASWAGADGLLARLGGGRGPTDNRPRCPIFKVRNMFL